MLITTAATYFSYEAHSFIHTCIYIYIYIFNNCGISQHEPFSLPSMCLFYYVFLVLHNQSSLFHCRIHEISHNLEKQAEFLDNQEITNYVYFYLAQYFFHYNIKS